MSETEWTMKIEQHDSPKLSSDRCGRTNKASVTAKRSGGGRAVIAHTYCKVECDRCG